MSLIEKFECGDVVENRYHLDIKIHEGRWGDIYKATDRTNDRSVAVRFFPTPDSGPEDFDRFQAHARELSGLTAPSISTPADHGLHDEIPYLVFRWAPGQNLQDRLAERGALELEQTLTILEEMLGGLARAHDSRMTHGLIRPVKVVVDDLETDDPFVKVVDFQIWRFFEWARAKDAFNEDHLSRRIVRYTSPEVIEDHRVKPSTDVYATGLLAIEFLTGQPAFEANNRVALIGQQLSDEDPELGSTVSVSQPFQTFIEKLVAKNEDERFRTAGEALDFFETHRDKFELEEAAGDESAGDVPEGAGITNPPPGMKDSSSESDSTPEDDSGGPDPDATEDSQTQVVSGPAAAAAATEDPDATEDSQTQVVSGPAAAAAATGDSEAAQARRQVQESTDEPADEPVGDEDSDDIGIEVDDEFLADDDSDVEFTRNSPTAGADEQEDQDEEVDPDEELFEGDPASMRSLSDGESFAEDAEDADEQDDEPTKSDDLLDDDEDDPLFDDGGDFGQFTEDNQSETTSSAGGADQQASDSPPSRPGSGAADSGSPLESGPPAEDQQDQQQERQFDESIAADIPEASRDPDSDPWAGPDAPKDGPRAPKMDDSSVPEADRPGPTDSGAHPSRQQAGPPPGTATGSSAGDGSDITLGQAAALAVGMLALLSGAIIYVTVSGDDTTDAEAAVAESEQDEEPEETYVLEIYTDPPGQRVETSGGHSGLSTLEIEVPESEFPLEVRARKNPEVRAERILDEPTDEVHIDFDD